MAERSATSSKFCLIAVSLAPISALLAQAHGEQFAAAAQRNFVACPIVMDTPDIPCWVAEYQGERYFLTVQTGRGRGIVYAPQLKHRVLVEGTLTDAPRICGGIVLKDVKLSALPEVSLECNQRIPSQGYRVVGPRPIGPDGDLTVAQTGVGAEARKTTAVISDRVPPDQKAEARAARLASNAPHRNPLLFEVKYFFDSNYVSYPHPQSVVLDAWNYAEMIDASKVRVTGYRGKVLLTGAPPAVERAGLAKMRAERVAFILEEFGVPKDRLEVIWREAPVHQNGERDYELRQVTIEVMP